MVLAQESVPQTGRPHLRRVRLRHLRRDPAARFYFRDVGPGVPRHPGRPHAGTARGISGPTRRILSRCCGCSLLPLPRQLRDSRHASALPRSSRNNPRGITVVRIRDGDSVDDSLRGTRRVVPRCASNGRVDLHFLYPGPRIFRVAGNTEAWPVSGRVRASKLPYCLNAKSKRSTRCCKMLNSAVRLIQRTNLGGSSETTCTTSDSTYTRRRSAIA